MPPSVFTADEQSDHPVDILRWTKLAEAVLRDEGVRGETEVSVLFVDETTIADLSSRFLGKQGPTDVLAFPIDDEPIESGRSPDSGGSGPGFTSSDEEEPSLLGDVVICPAVAYRNAPDHAGTFDDEIALLVVHGILHLLGMDHEDSDEAEAMEAKERALLARYHQAPADPSPGDPSPPATPSPATPAPGDPATGDPAPSPDPALPADPVEPDSHRDTADPDGTVGGGS